MPLILLLNKIDTVKQDVVVKHIEDWKKRADFLDIIPISALNKFNTDALIEKLLTILPEGPKYYPDDQLTDRSERFFTSEMIREKILLLYSEEIPYSCEVVIDSFKEGKTNLGKDIIRIGATIFVARKTQKPIMLGKDGSMIKKLGTEARKELEKFFDSAVFLELFIKVKENWRDDDRLLDYFGYNQ